MEERTASGLHEFIFNQFFVDLDRSLKILDVGCGTGAWLNRLEKAGFNQKNLIGIDLDDVSAHDSKLITGVDLNKPDWLSYKYNRFDLITSIEVVEHITNQSIFLENISNALVPGGRAFITTPNIASLNARARFFLKGRLPQFDELADPTHFSPIYQQAFERSARRFHLTMSAIHTFPKSRGQSQMYSFLVKAFASISATVLPDSTPGDIVIFEMKKNT